MASQLCDKLSLDKSSSTCTCLAVVGFCASVNSLEKRFCRCFQSVTGVFNFIFEPRHQISNNVVCTASKASDQPAHMRSLIRAFAGHLNILRLLSF